MTFTYTDTFQGAGNATPSTPVLPDPNQPALGSIGAAGGVAGSGASRLVHADPHRLVPRPRHAIADRAPARHRRRRGCGGVALGYDASWSWDALGSVVAPQR